MSRKTFVSRFVPRALRTPVPTVPVVRLTGTIGIGSVLRPALTLQGVKSSLERAFTRKRIEAVAIVINSPGGSAVQSSLIAGRIRDLAEENKVKVIAFVEDVAASGGYWLALSGDEIYANQSSIVGSIGVMASSFGFVDAMKKLGIERRVYTAGKNKVALDPFQPEKQEDVARIMAIQADVHEAFKSVVRERRGKRIAAADEDLFTGAFWSGKKSLDLGLVDGLGDLHGVLRQKYGPKVDVVETQRQGGWLQRRITGAPSFLGASAIAGLAEEMEVRALWGRFGL